MKLIYMYVEEFRNLKNAEFHFDRTFDIKMDIENNRLDISDAANSSTIKNVNDYLFENTVIDNVTAIIGENGVGKSSVLDAIQHYCDSIDKKFGKSILIFSDKDKILHVWSNISIYIHINTSSYNLNYEPNKNFEDVCKKFQIVKLSNLFDIKNYHEFPDENIINLTDGYLMKEDLNTESDLGVNKDINVLLNHNSYQTKRQLDFFSNYNKAFQKLELPLKMPTQLRIQVVDFSKKINAVFDSKNTILNEEHNQSLKETFLRIKTRNDLNIFKKISLNLVLDVLNYVNLPINVDYSKEKYSEHIFLSLESYLLENIEESNLERTDANLLELLGNTFKDIANKNGELAYVIKKAIYFINSLLFSDNLLKEGLIFQIDKYSQKTFGENSWIIDINKENDVINLIYTLFDAHKESTFYLTCFQFDWRGLSSGEYNMLNTFSKLFSIIDKGDIKQKQHILLLIDEADATFHPEWQANYMKFLITYLNSLFKNKSIQIILTTHSPIILSDFVSFNTIYLSKNGKLPHENYTKTFGQNIFTLFSDAFFLEYPKGRFVKEIILKIDEELKSFESGDKKSNEKINFVQLKDVINEIGEPIIRNLYISKLESLREHYRGSQLNELMKLYEGLGTDERNEFIDFIISKEE